MSEQNVNTQASANGKPGGPNAAVIRRLDAAEETTQERLLKKHVPAWVVSGAIHVGIIALMIFLLGDRTTTAKPTEKVLSTTAEKTEEEQEVDLTNDNPGIISDIDTALPEIERVEKQTVDEKVTADPIGQPDMANLDTTALAPQGLPSMDLTNPGTVGDTGSLATGMGGGNGFKTASFDGRGGATKSRLIAEGGGNTESERAVGRGLSWIARQQKKDGGWEYDLGKKEHRAAATGMALLPFLAAGETHKPPRGKTKVNDYSKVVSEGLGFLMKMCPPSGPNAGRISSNMYEQGIAAMTLCEAYGMTRDPILKPYAQAAINYVQRGQGPNGSWGYTAGVDGDVSIVGWQVQALEAAKLSKDLIVDDRVLKKAIHFLDIAASGSRKSMYGYRSNKDAAPGTALTAVGLLSRYYLDGWGPNNPGMIDGVQGLVTKKMPVGNGQMRDMYYYYYATQVVHFFEGEDWKNWNQGLKGKDGQRKGGMRDWLVTEQIKKDGANLGSWEPENGWFGNSCGRLGTTCVCLLTLEVYYRHLPLYKRSADGNAKVDADK